MIENDFFLLETGQATDTGKVRSHNEDSHLSRPDFGLWVVADGMGGHDAGDFASQSITAEVASVGLSSSLTDLEARFMERLQRANDSIRRKSDSLGGATVGATMVALLVHDDDHACIWSGDSRIYRFRDGHLLQLTEDHTEVQSLVNSGAISPEEARVWPRRNIITRAIGVTDTPHCDMRVDRVRVGDAFLLCSDGLTEHLTDDDIAAHLSRRDLHAQMICNALIAETLDRGAKDNVTCIVVRCHARPLV